MDPRRGRARRRGRGGRSARAGRGPPRRGRHTRAREHPPSPVPDAHARPRAGRDALRVAPRALPDVGGHRRGDGVRGRPLRPRGARPLRAARRCSTTTTSSRAASPGSSRRRSPRRGSSASASSRRAGRWTSASPTAGFRPTRSSRTSTTVLADTERLAALADGDLVQIAVAPCSPFSVTTRLMEESAALARRLGLRLHTHLAETVEEDAYCRELFGCTPVEYLERVGWLDGDVWCAHCVHLSDADVATFGRTGVGVAHCPTSNLRLGAGRRARAGAARRRRARRPRRRRNGLERARRPLPRGEERAARRARPRRPGRADRARGAPPGNARRRRRPRPRRLGSLEPGKRADFAVWAVDGLAFGGADDLVANLVLSGPHRVRPARRRRTRRRPRTVELVAADEEEIAREHRKQAARLWTR